LSSYQLFKNKTVAQQPKARFDAFVLDETTKMPIKGDFAVIMRNKAIVMSRSTSTDSTGYIFAAVDTVPGTRLRVTISCSGYESHTASYVMKSDFYGERKIFLSKSSKQKEL
jgi:hypothetical protein